MAFVYSCCFWFSLRLGGILIGIFSLFQASVLLGVCCWAYNHTQEIKDRITFWLNNLILMYARDYLEDFSEGTKNKEPSKHIAFVIITSCIYILMCLLFIYGAYMYNNILMVAFILLELLRLVVISAVVATGLLLLKQNTMDIGILIGASVAGGFLLLGMFYLWICVANLPILINEMERDQQLDTIKKLRQLVETKNQRNDVFSDRPRRSNVFMIPNNRMRFVKPTATPGLISVGH